MTPSVSATLGPMLFSQNALVYLALLLALFLHYILYKTHYGLALRSVGESPRDN